MREVGFLQVILLILAVLLAFGLIVFLAEFEWPRP
jgi:hypothetical protein